jgi:hypothetical protein
MRMGNRVLVGVTATAALLAVVYCVACVLTDAPPIPNDYTIADVRSAALQYNTSYELVQKLGEGMAPEKSRPELGLTAGDGEVLAIFGKALIKGDPAEIAEVCERNRDSIKLAWQHGAKGREIISRLSEYQEIADLTPVTSDARGGKENIWQGGADILNLMYLYVAYIRVEAADGDIESAARELVRFDVVFRKLSANARETVTKIICLIIMKSDVETAEFLLNSPRLSPQVARVVKEHFTPLTAEQLSVTNTMIFEYLSFGEIANILTLGTNRANLLLKPMSSRRMWRNSIEYYIAKAEGREVDAARQLSVWPGWVSGHAAVAVNPAKHQLSIAYRCYNWLGSRLVEDCFSGNQYDRLIKAQVDCRQSDERFHEGQKE